MRLLVAFVYVCFPFFFVNLRGGCQSLPWPQESCHISLSEGYKHGKNDYPQMKGRRNAYSKISTNLVSHFLLGGKTNIFCFLKDSEILREHLSSQPESRHVDSKLGQVNLQPIHSILLPAQARCNINMVPPISKSTSSQISWLFQPPH